MEYSGKEQLSPYIMPASVLVIMFGVFNAIMGAGSVIVFFMQGEPIAGYESQLMQIGVLALIGALQIVSGALALKSRTNEKLRNTCKTLGFSMLLATAAYVVTTVFFRGFQWSTMFSVAAAVFYMSAIKPQKH